MNCTTAAARPCHMQWRRDLTNSLCGCRNFLVGNATLMADVKHVRWHPDLVYTLATPAELLWQRLTLHVQAIVGHMLASAASKLSSAVPRCNQFIWLLLHTGAAY
jgi:hypothetical protein